LHISPAISSVFNLSADGATVDAWSYFPGFKVGKMSLIYKFKFWLWKLTHKSESLLYKNKGGGQLKLQNNVSHSLYWYAEMFRETRWCISSTAGYCWY
jgi:hypothetical protein